MPDSVAWIVVTVDDLDDYLVAKAMDALRTKKLRVGQVDPFTTVMHAVADRIRAEIRGCDRNQVSETAYAIPPSLKQIACLMIVEAMQGRLPGVTLNDGQQEMLRDGRRYLERISRCDVPIEMPEDPEETPTTQSGTVGKMVTYRTRVATREKMIGL